MAFLSNTVADGALPLGSSGLYIGGGFPELYAAALAANEPMRRAIAAAAAAGMPIYAECGGLMYLGQSIVDFDGREHPMVGAIPARSRLDGHRLSLGYRIVQSLGAGPLLRRGEVARGHEFHWSVLDAGAAPLNAYRVLEPAPRREGFQVGNMLASYIHLHLASVPTMARRFVERCRRYRERGRG